MRGFSQIEEKGGVVVMLHTMIALDTVVVGVALHCTHVCYIKQRYTLHLTTDIFFSLFSLLTLRTAPVSSSRGDSDAQILIPWHLEEWHCTLPCRSVYVLEWRCQSDDKSESIGEEKEEISVI